MSISRATSGVNLPAEVSSEIWQNIQAASVVMGLARKVDLSGAGTVYHEILTDSQPAFVGETARKPLSDPTIGNKLLKPHKIAVVQSYSDEFRRDLPGLYNALVGRLPGALAKTFDLAALHGTGAPVSDFDTLENATQVSVLNATQGSVDAYQGFLNALAAVSAGGGDVNAWALSALGEITALSNRDTTGGPIFLNSPITDGSVGSILGRPVFRSQNAGEAGSAAETDPVVAGVPATLGIAGDWNAARYGVVSGVEISVSDNPVYNGAGVLQNAGWQDNMFSVRAEIHVGFIADDSKFVRLTGATPAA